MTPEGDQVEVDLEYDAKYQRARRRPGRRRRRRRSVSDRYVQLLPAYTGGAGDGRRRRHPARPHRRAGRAGPDHRAAWTSSAARSARAAPTRTARCPTCWTPARDEPRRQRPAAPRHRRDLSQAAATLAGGRDDLFGTVKNLQTFTSTLAAQRPAGARGSTPTWPASPTSSPASADDLGAALKNLAVALGEVATLRPRQPGGATTDVSRAGRRHGRRGRAEGRDRRDPATTPRSPCPTSGTPTTRRPARWTTGPTCPAPRGSASCSAGWSGTARRPATRPALCDLFNALNDRLSALGDTGTGDLPLGLLGSRIPGGTP